MSTTVIDRLSDWQRMTELVSLVLATGAVENAAPQSLLIVGGPGTGKTALVERFSDADDVTINPSVRLVGNLSSWGLRNFLRMEVPRGVTHMVVPEFQTVFMRRSETWQTVQGLLLQALAEGVGDYYNGPNPESYGKARIGLVACVARDSYMGVRHELQKTGFLSRVLVVRWSRTRKQIEDSIRRANKGDLKDLSKVTLELPTIRRTIGMSDKLSDIILAYTKAKFSDELNRAYRRFQALTMAAALCRGANSAALRDWHTVLHAERFWLGEV